MDSSCQLCKKDKCFDHGLLDFCPNDYFFVGLMMGIALLQNGQLPKFLPEDIITQLVLPSNDPCYKLQNGFQIFGFVQFFRAFPCLLQLLQPREDKDAFKPFDPNVFTRRINSHL